MKTHGDITFGVNDHPSIDECPECGTVDLAFCGWTGERTDADITDVIECPCGWTWERPSTALTAILLRNGSRTDHVSGAPEEIAAEVRRAEAEGRMAMFWLTSGHAMSVSVNCLRVRTVAV